MSCIGHQSPGLWTHPDDRADTYNTLEYWTDLARILERGKFDALFLADVLGIYDVYKGSPRTALEHAVQVPGQRPADADLRDGRGHRTSGLRCYLRVVVRASLPVRSAHEHAGPSDQGADRLEHRHRLPRQRGARDGDGEAGRA